MCRFDKLNFSITVCCQLRIVLHWVDKAMIGEMLFFIGCVFRVRVLMIYRKNLEELRGVFHVYVILVKLFGRDALAPQQF